MIMISWLKEKIDSISEAFYALTSDDDSIFRKPEAPEPLDNVTPVLYIHSSEEEARRMSDNLAKCVQGNGPISLAEWAEKHRHKHGGFFIAIDPSAIADLEPQEQMEARNTLNWLLMRTRQKLGPGEWLQVIRRNKNDGRFTGEPETTTDLFKGDADDNT